MADLSAAKRARMACRVYLKLHDAGPEGAPILKEDVFGPRDDPDADLDAALGVIGRFMDDTILDEVGHRGGVAHYALTAGMRDRMAARGEAGRPAAESLRDDLAAADRGSPVADDVWTRAELTIRSGDPAGEPL